MRVIPTSVHGILDYIVGAVLIAAPWLLGFAEGGAETWVPVIIGAATIIYSLMTSYEYGVVGAISMNAHLTMDVIGGAILAASPWIFDFNEIVWVPHLVVGLLEIGAGLMTKTTPTRIPRTAGPRTTGV